MSWRDIERAAAKSEIVGDSKKLKLYAFEAWTNLPESAIETAFTPPIAFILCLALGPKILSK